jgi:SAM-dependent methyltransferase
MSQNAWDERAEAYRTSLTHASGEDLDAVIELCEPAPGVTILDVATGGGHVARRLREQGATVVTCDASPGMRPDVITPAEHLPFADDSFDVVVTRIAAHHFDDLPGACTEMARVARRAVVVEDMLYRTPEEDEAEKLRDPTHVRSRTPDEWRALVTGAGLEIEEERFFAKEHGFDEWLARTGCEGETAARVRELLAPVATDDGERWSNDYIVLLARKARP